MPFYCNVLEIKTLKVLLRKIPVKVRCEEQLMPLLKLKSLPIKLNLGTKVLMQRGIKFGVLKKVVISLRNYRKLSSFKLNQASS